MTRAHNFWTNKQVAALRELYTITYSTKNEFTNALDEFVDKCGHSRASVYTMASNMGLKHSYNHKRMLQISIYITAPQYADLRRRAAGKSLNHYITQVLFDDNRNPLIRDSVAGLDSPTDLSAPREQLGSETVLRGGVADG